MQHNYQLPDKTENQKDEVIQSLIEDLFHMDDIQAEKIKKQYIQKYHFINENDIKYL